MKMTEFAEKYHLHDSLVTNIAYSPEKKTVDITLELCLWAQDGYKEGDPEVGIAHMLFSGVSAYSDAGLIGKVDFFSILEAFTEHDTLVLSLFDDFNDVEYDLSITAQNVRLIS